MILLTIVVFISIMVPAMLLGEEDKETEIAIDKVKLLMIGTRFSVAAGEFTSQ